MPNLSAQRASEKLGAETDPENGNTVLDSLAEQPSLLGEKGVHALVPGVHVASERDDRPVLAGANAAHVLLPRLQPSVRKAARLEPPGEEAQPFEALFLLDDENWPHGRNASHTHRTSPLYVAAAAVPAFSLT